MHRMQTNNAIILIHHIFAIIPSSCRGGWLVAGVSRGVGGTTNMPMAGQYNS
jgi:hypothetical protein